MAAKVKKVKIPSDAYSAIVISNHDGDSMTVTVDTKLEQLLGRKQYFQIDVRLSNIDTPEINSDNQELKALAVKARDRVAELCPVGSTVILSKVTPDKYGRTNATVILQDGKILQDILVEEGLAKLYNGSGVKPW